MTSWRPIHELYLEAAENFDEMAKLRPATSALGRSGFMLEFRGDVLAIVAQHADGHWCATMPRKMGEAEGKTPREASMALLRMLYQRGVERQARRAEKAE
jgi:hypothetical protein